MELKNYKIYAGLGGSFGGADYLYTEKNVTLVEALDIAYGEALEKYENFAGMHGLPSYTMIEKEIKEENPDISEDDLEECAVDTYQETVERWICYYVEEDEEDEEEDYMAYNCVDE